MTDSVHRFRTESLLLIIALTTSNAEIQKLLAFEGAFDKLFSIVRNEGGIGSGGIVVQDCLAAIAGLLRWNVSNQVSSDTISVFFVPQTKQLVLASELFSRNVLYPSPRPPPSLPSTQCPLSDVTRNFRVPILVRTENDQRRSRHFADPNAGGRCGEWENGESERIAREWSDEMFDRIGFG